MKKQYGKRLYISEGFHDHLLELGILVEDSDTPVGLQIEQHFGYERPERIKEDPPLETPLRRGPYIYKDLAIGESLICRWQISPTTGHPSNWKAIANAVRNSAKKTGYIYQKEHAGIGIKVTRVR